MPLGEIFGMCQMKVHIQGVAAWFITAESGIVGGANTVACATIFFSIGSVVMVFETEIIWITCASSCAATAITDTIYILYCFSLHMFCLTS